MTFRLRAVPLLRKTTTPPGQKPRSGEYVAVRPPADPGTQSTVDLGLDFERIATDGAEAKTLARHAERSPASDWPFDASATAANAPMCDVVHIRGEAGEGMVVLLDGALAWVRASRLAPPFRDHLKGTGHVSEQELDLVSTLCDGDVAAIVGRLLALDLVDRHVLREVMCTYAHQTLAALMAMPGREASWTRAPFPVAPDLVVPLKQVFSPAELRLWRRLLVDAGGSPVHRHDESRIPLRRTAQVETVLGSIMMTTVDISEAGIRLRSNTTLPMASPVLVRLNVAGDRLELSGRVVRFDRSPQSPNDPPLLVVLWTALPAATEEAFARILDALY